MKTPIIGGPDQHDFHDCYLMRLVTSPLLDTIEIIVKTTISPFEDKEWRIRFNQVLEFKYKTSGNGVSETFPLEIYDIYIDKNSDLSKYWNKRLFELDVTPDVKHVVLGSSLYCDWDWGNNDRLEGINIVCRNIDIGFY